jgi:hypothetical protein
MPSSEEDSAELRATRNPSDRAGGCAARAVQSGRSSILRGTTMDDVNSGLKKRKLVLNRETVMPLQGQQLSLVVGGDNAKPDDNLIRRGAESAAVSGAASAIVTAIAAESASACAVASASASAAAATVDHVSNRLGLPCWVATSVASASLHFTRKW